MELRKLCVAHHVKYHIILGNLMEYGCQGLDLGLKEKIMTQCQQHSDNRSLSSDPRHDSQRVRRPQKTDNALVARAETVAKRACP